MKQITILISLLLMSTLTFGVELYNKDGIFIQGYDPHFF